MINDLNLSEKILFERRKRNLTQEELGIALGVSAQAISNWERGGYPDITMLPGIANYFKISVDELLGRKPMEGQDNYIKPMTPEARLLVSGVDRMPEEDRKKALNIMCTVFDQYKNYFEGNDAE
jgi:transcriptional regulator with XRE-family HTH domain